MRYTVALCVVMTLACVADIAFHLTPGGHAFRVKTADYYTGSIGKTSVVAARMT
jgi:hypothetical protein